MPVITRDIVDAVVMGGLSARVAEQVTALHHLLHQFRVDSLHKDVGHVRLDHSWSFGDGLRFKPQG